MEMNQLTFTTSFQSEKVRAIIARVIKKEVPELFNDDNMEFVEIPDWGPCIRFQADTPARVNYLAISFYPVGDYGYTPHQCFS